ncbi:MAG: uracil-DNA glycosylase [Euryarchaeota archaeon]|nr:uracil-DNA glycosylase [Euryarchaeota archaeon]
MTLNNELSAIEDAIRDCRRCELHETVTNRVIRKGSDDPKVLFIGEAPGKNEDETGVPFCGRAGTILDEIIGYMGLPDEDWAVVNAIKCRPPKNRNPRTIELQACKPFLTEQIELLDPNVIILLGNTAQRAFCPEHPLQWGATEMIEGRCVLKIYHPAALIYTRSRRVDQYRFLDEHRYLWQ